MWHHAPVLEMAAWPPLLLAFVPQTPEDRGRAGDAVLEEKAAWSGGDSCSERMGTCYPAPPGLPHQWIFSVFYTVLRRAGWRGRGRKRREERARRVI